MRSRRLLLTVVFFLSSLASASAAKVRVDWDIPYKAGTTKYERERCKLDLYLPARKGFPVVVWFHGGSLSMGGKEGETDKRVARRLVEAGIGCVLVNYRLSPRVQHPAYVEDAAAAVAWVATNIDKYGGNPKDLFISGHSAGGFLTAILGVDPQFLATHGMTLADVRGVIPISGQMSTHTTIQADRGGVVSEERVVDSAAPLFHVKNLGPPHLIIAGTQDSPDREEVNRDYAKALQDAGHKDVTLLVVPDRTHGTIIELFDQPDDAVAVAVLKFIHEHLTNRLEPVEIGSMAPVHMCGDLLLAGQPSPQDLELLKERGVKTIINVRHPGEIDWDEAAAVARNDMTYIHVPFNGEAELTDEVFDKVLSALRNKENGPTIFHCASANRVGAIWYVHRILEEGIHPKIAEREAREVGLRNPAYLSKAQAYIEKSKQAASSKRLRHRHRHKSRDRQPTASEDELPFAQ